MKVAIVLNCGTKIARKIKGDKIICCDGGYSFCDVQPDVLLGDFDSLPQAENEGFLERVSDDTVIVRHDPHKNASDGELAVYYAREQLGATEITFYGVLGGRYDHTLCNFAIMKLASDLGMTAKAEEDGLDIYYIKGEREIPTQKGETVSILPFGGNAVVTCSDNLEYPLKELMLTGADARGLSNVSLGGNVNVDVKYGGVLMFRYIKK